jgi:hypothetical protein
MENEGGRVELTFINNPHAPDFFATGATGFFLNQGNVHITFEALRVDHTSSPGPVNRVVIGRLVMPLAAAQGMAAGLYDFLKSHGVVTDFMPPPNTHLN